MSRPGTTITRSENRSTRSIRTGTGPWFVAGITGTADADTDPTKVVPSFAEYARRFGSRAQHVTAGDAILFDSMEAYFADGGAEAYVSRTADAVTATLTAALGLLVRDLGPGQVSAPGRTSADQQVAVAAHAEITNRTALIDLPNSATVATLTAAADPAGITTNQGRVSGGFGGAWVQIPPAATGGAIRVIPPSPIVAAAMARNDARGRSQNEPSAGELGISSYAVGVTQQFTDSDRNTLNANGVNVLKPIDGEVVIYGYRTLADPVSDPNWVDLSNARLFMAVQADCDAVAKRFVFRQLDGQRLTIAEYGGALTGVILPYWQKGSLFGATPGEAFRVDVGTNVNTIDSMANKELNASVYLKVSPFAEEVKLNINKTKITEAV